MWLRVVYQKCPSGISGTHVATSSIHSIVVVCHRFLLLIFGSMLAGMCQLSNNTTNVSADPIIQGADIIAQTKVEMTPGQPLTYRWEGHGFEVHIPAGAIPAESGLVTMGIQASLSGDYHLPDDRVLVSGVYWVSLHPPIEFAKKVTVNIQHCGSVEDSKSALSFITATFMRESRPYIFKPLEGGFFLYSGRGTIAVDHFSGLSIFGRKKAKYAICTYYLPQPRNVYEIHIAVTAKVELILKV